MGCVFCEGTAAQSSGDKCLTPHTTQPQTEKMSSKLCLFAILPGRCEFTPPNRGEKKTSDGTYFFGGGFIESENCFETHKGSTID